MSLAPDRSAQEIILDTFAGLVTETPASNLPPGVSPDCQEMTFVPGAVQSRPALSKVFSTPFSGTPTVTYGKSYVDPTGTIRNLYLDSAGVIHVENVTTGAGTYSTGTTLSETAGYARSVTAFGREYIAPSDGLHGNDIPLQFDGTNWDRVTQEGPGAGPTVANFSIAPAALTGTGGLSRSGTTVTATTAAAHSFKVGYQVQIQGVASQAIGAANNITSIVIDNEDSPGLATITLNTSHGLVPGAYVSILNVQAVTVGTGISSTSTQGGIVTVTTSASHNLSPGAVVILTGATDTTVNGTWVVASVPYVNQFTFGTNATANTTGAAGGTVKLNWPIASTLGEVYQVQTCPSSTVFTVSVTYSDGTWTTGTVYSPWNGTFYVTSVPTTTTFTYFNPGPTMSTGTVAINAIYYGQITPGTHLCQVLFQTRQGYITRGSAPVSVIAPGGQYLQITNIPIGPSNVVARILQFTGAQPSTQPGTLAPFYYIPVPAMVGTETVSTSTVINDNTTTSVTLDFSDNTLFASTGTSVPGNDVNSQIVIDGALGFGYYTSRLITWGQRNTVQNFKNLSFDGGYLSGATTVPLGWTVGGSGSLVTTGRWGGAYQLGAGSDLTQTAYLDAYGAEVLEPNQTYRVRCWLKGATASVTFTVSAVSTGFSSTITLSTTSTTGAWVEGALSLVMPATIPSDMLFGFSGTSGTVDEISVIYAQKPYSDDILYGSYVNNPEAFDGTSGAFGPDDTRKVMGIGILRSALCILTREPGGRLYMTTANGYTEPAGWTVDEVAGSTGALSTFCIAVSQADDATAAAGEEWLAWASLSGARIFGGDQPWKVSQEIQPDWDSMNPAAYLTVWAVNDPVARRLYFGLPIGGGTAPTVIYPMDYRRLDTAAEIAASPPVRTTLTGKLMAHDKARKWTRWNIASNGAALMYRSTNPTLQFVVLNGNGGTPGAIAGYGNVYTLSGATFTDDDYGIFYPWYVTYFFTSAELEQGLGITAQYHMVQYMSANVSGVGSVTVTVFPNDLTNPWPLTVTRALYQYPRFDLEWSAANATGQRFAFKFAPTS